MSGCVALHVLETNVRVVVKEELHAFQTAERTTLHESCQSVVILQLTWKTRANLFVDVLDGVDNAFQNGGVIYSRCKVRWLLRVMWMTVSMFSFSKLTSAPASKSKATFSSLPAATAHMSGVYPDYS